MKYDLNEQELNAVRNLMEIGVKALSGDALRQAMPVFLHLDAKFKNATVDAPPNNLEPIMKPKAGNASAEKHL